jgi:hypothetical protein
VARIGFFLPVPSSEAPKHRTVADPALKAFLWAGQAATRLVVATAFTRFL